MEAEILKRAKIENEEFIVNQAMRKKILEQKQQEKERYIEEHPSEEDATIDSQEKKELQKKIEKGVAIDGFDKITPKVQESNSKATLEPSLMTGEDIDVLTNKLDKTLQNTKGASEKAIETFEKLGALTVEQIEEKCKGIWSVDLEGCEFHDWKEDLEPPNKSDMSKTQLEEWKTDDSTYQGTKLVSNKRRHGIVHMVTYGAIVTRMYKNGKFHGYSRFIQQNGGFREGYHNMGKMCDYWNFVEPDGSIREKADYGMPTIPDSMKPTVVNSNKTSKQKL